MRKCSILIYKEFWGSPAIVLALMLFLSPANLSAQTGSSCECSDIPYLIDQLGRSYAALDTLRQYETRVGPNETYNEMAAEPNPNRWTKGQILLNEIIRAMAIAQIKPPPLTSARCVGSLEKYRDSIRAGMRNPMSFMPLRTYITEMKEVYRLEINEIMRIMKELSSKCPPLDWFGTITTVDTQEMNGVITAPAENEFDLEDVEKTDMKTIRTGMIRFDGRSPKPMSSWQVSGSDSYSDVKQGLVDCDTSDKIALVPSKSELRREVDKTRSGPPPDVEVSLEVSEDGRSILVNFQLPAVEVKTNGLESQTMSGGCPGDNLPPKRDSFSTEYSLPKEDVKLRGIIRTENPRHISGSETFDITPPVSLGDGKNGVKKTHKVIITYHLYKFRR